MAFSMYVIMLVTLEAAAGAPVFGAGIVRLGKVIDVSPTDNLAAVVRGAAAGDELRLADGEYRTEKNKGLYLTKDLAIRASNEGQATILGQGYMYGPAVIRVGERVTAHLVGLKITQGYGEGAGGVHVPNLGSLTMTACNIFNNTANNGGSGGGILNEGSLTMISCNIFNNTAEDPGAGGIYSDRIAKVGVASMERWAPPFTPLHGPFHSPARLCPRASPALFTHSRTLPPV